VAGGGAAAGNIVVGVNVYDEGAITQPRQAAEVVRLRSAADDDLMGPFQAGDHPEDDFKPVRIAPVGSASPAPSTATRRAGAGPDVALPDDIAPYFSTMSVSSSESVGFPPPVGV
jgi:hypothetical protein